MSDSSTARRQAMSYSALWYAYGRKDAGERRVDPEIFRKHYLTLVENNIAGVCSYVPSIQDAYNDFLEGTA